MPYLTALPAKEFETNEKVEWSISCSRSLHALPVPDMTQTHSALNSESPSINAFSSTVSKSKTVQPNSFQIPYLSPGSAPRSNVNSWKSVYLRALDAIVEPRGSAPSSSSHSSGDSSNLNFTKFSVQRDSALEEQRRLSGMGQRMPFVTKADLTGLKTNISRKFSTHNSLFDVTKAS
ncbi:unnamed protein product [Protopolystoma xenopodis]|uniref:Uncharacterized protein n=1 Tax=Protopolystoma xenopodis TaxID=117903 RepID=A0A448XHM8_9PLAT|nr:unnamed protein product [Protopolystoma xenopodis]